MNTAAANESIARRLAEFEAAARAAGSERLIEDALGDSCMEVRARASTIAARHLSPERLARLVAQGDNLARRAAAMAALARAGERALPALVEGSRHPLPTVALFFVQVLGHIRASQALQRLRELATHSDPLLAQAAIEGLGNQGDRESVPLLIATLEATPWLGLASVAALGKIGDARAVAPLERLSGDEILGEAIAAALGVLRAQKHRGLDA